MKIFAGVAKIDWEKEAILDHERVGTMNFVPSEFETSNYCGICGWNKERHTETPFLVVLPSPNPIRE